MSRAWPRDSDRLRYLAIGALLSVLSTSFALACVVGSGTISTCTEAALDVCLPGGGMFDGTVTFDCGGAATIGITQTKTIDVDTIIDGGNTITISGGGTVRVLFIDPPAAVTIQNLRIADGHVSGDSGGGIFNAGRLTLTHATLSNNSSFYDSAADNGGYGGALLNTGGIVDVTASVFSGNAAVVGAAVFSSGGNLTVQDSRFFGNAADAAGGYGSAIYSSFETATIRDSTFSANSGGDIVDSNINGTMAIVGSTFAGNRGGVISNAGTLTLTNSTLSGNTTNGSALFNFPGATLIIRNSTLAGNSTNGSCFGVIDNDFGDVVIANTILANNDGRNCAGGNCDAAGIIDGGHNIDDGATCGFAGADCADTGGSSFCNTNPLLDPGGLADHGGPTQTFALCTGAAIPAGCPGMSPAINAGDNAICADPPVSSLDQRGISRSGDSACDIGAFEAPPTCLRTPPAGAKTCGTIADSTGRMIQCGCPLPPPSGPPAFRVSVTVPGSTRHGRALAMGAAYVPAVVTDVRGSAPTTACVASAPAGTRAVTECATKSFKTTHGRTTLTLRLNALGRKLVRQSGRLDAKVVGALTGPQGTSSPFEALGCLLRGPRPCP